MKNFLLTVAGIPLLLVFHSASGSGEEKPAIAVSGIVTSRATGEPLPGVNVNVKGTTLGTVTDVDGRYSLQAPDENEILIYSFVGYKALEIPINGRSVIHVALAEDVETLEEIVVVGYGTVKKSDLTGSVASLGAADFNPGIQSSVDQMIQGRSPGVQITQTSSEPGGGVSIRVRGATSLTAGNEPLYVIDGLPIDNSPAMPGSTVNNNQSPRNPLNSLNPGDIESIEVLKDASATAIYGSRGANGVILITTKKGRSGEMSVNYNASVGIQEVAKRLDLLTATEYMNLLNEIRMDAGESPEFSQEEMSAVGEGTDWQSEIFQNAPIQNHQLALSGGSESTQYYVSLNYLNQKGLVISSGMERYIARLNLNHVVDRFKFGMNLNTSYIRDDYIPSGVAFNQNAGVIASALQMDPTLPLRDADGNYMQTEIVDIENPVGLAYGVNDDGEANRTFGNIFAEYAIIGNLKAKINLGSDRQTARRDSYISDITKRGQTSGGRATAASNERSNYLMEFTMNYNKDFSENHRIDVVGGYTYQVFTRRHLSAEATGFATDAFQSNNIGAGTQSTFGIGSNKSKNQLQSYLGRINYTLFNKYLITGSFRIDGSSRFGRDYKYGRFPSLALGWRLGEESFISNLNVFTDLKLRASYGITGNQEIGNYNSLVLLGTVGEAALDENRFVGIAPIQIANPNLKWETTSQFNVGLDFAMLKGRISGSVDYFKKKTSDLLLNLPIPTTTGFGFSLQNVGATENKGFEILLNTDNLTGRFTWSSTLNVSTIRNKVTDLAGLPFILQGGGRFVNNISILREGDPMNSYFGYAVEGIFQSDQEVADSPQPLSRPGELKFRDVNQDNEITPEDRVVLGSPYPEFSGGFNNSFTYKGFDLSIFLEGVYGVELFNFNRLDSEYPISFRRNRQAYVLNRWTSDNPIRENPSYVDPVATYGDQVNSRVVEDASYLRVKNIQLGYNFSATGNRAINSAYIYFTIQNALTFTNYSGFNPDVNAFGDSNIRVDYNAYPLARIYSLGINIGL